MKVTGLLKVLALGFALFGPAAGCGSSTPSTTVTATSRQIRGRVTSRRPPGRTIARVVAVDAKTRRVVASAVPDAQGVFVLNNVMKGRSYTLTAIIGRTSRPITYPRPAGRMGKTNVFKVGARACSGRAQCDDGPIDLGEMTDNGIDIGPQDDMHNPSMFSDEDRDGMPDALDDDVDGDGMPNAMDNDNDGDMEPDSAAFGDTDGDGLTNDADPDVDNDGMPNSVDTDDDGNGVPDEMEPDVDGDGIPNAMDDDADGDGLPNTEDTDANGDGELDPAFAMDADGDGTPDEMDTDGDGDGVPDAMDTDTDNDGVPNEMDTDDDNDGMPDGSL